MLTWWDQGHRALPWRKSKDFYRVWISEIMLQQTRVEAVTPYFERFLRQFPSIEALAEAADADVLTAWSGLGYYSRARNLHRAAQQMVASAIPHTYNAVLGLPGVGPYSAAAISSIALDLPHPAIDGNVVRVIARLLNDSSPVTSLTMKQRIAETATVLLDASRPGDFNQAMMELGATICTPRNPACLICPVAALCAAREAGTEKQLPVKPPKAGVREVAIDLLVIESAGQVFLEQRSATASRLAGFWEFPERSRFPELGAEKRASFTHQIVNDRMRISVWTALASGAMPDAGHWFGYPELHEIPITTITRKALSRIQK